MNRKSRLVKSICVVLLAGTAAFYSAQPAWAAVFPPVANVVSNNQLPQGGVFAAGSGSISQAAGQNIMNIVQNQANAVIKWNDFSIGADAAVNFKKADGGAFNTLNYINSGKVSQIYGDINAAKGSIYIVNPSGVQIGDSAQINVGSLYVSNKKLNESSLGSFAGENISSLVDKTAPDNAELMSLGNINANKVIFDGSRVVIDLDRVRQPDKKTPLAAENIIVNTDTPENVVLGYTAFKAGSEGSGGSYAGANDAGISIAVINNETKTRADGYMWVKNVEELQAVNTNLSGNYALRNGIAASPSQEWNDKRGFIPIGSKETPFTGKFDGITYDIYNLKIADGDLSAAGLFGYTLNAAVRNVTMTGGSITGGNNVGSVIGQMTGGSLSNVKSSANVSGSAWVSGVVGSADGAVMADIVNGGKVKGTDFNNSIGGIAGMINNSSLTGTSYNIGDVSGGSFVGGIAGYASDSVIGSGDGSVYISNYLNVTGYVNVGGIVGAAAGNTVISYVSNEGNILSNNKYTEQYSYHTNNEQEVKKNADVSNTGGIVGLAQGSEDGKKRVKVNNARNKGDVKTATAADQAGDEYFISGNVGGIVGKALLADIADADNYENEIRGAHNVGGIAGYLDDAAVTNGNNHGGNIMATGARITDAAGVVRVVKESVRPSRAGSEESFIIGNMGGIVGYMHGDASYITDSANRGTVHSKDITNPDKISDSSKAANAGGVVGKIDREETKSAKDIKKGIAEGKEIAAVRNSSNSAEVKGYTNVGGIAGSMFDGEITGSFNMGNISSTQKIDTDGTQIQAVNMGGIVGDTTEETVGKVYIYDVYNKGQIGDASYTYGGRHVGGIAGRLSGTVEKAYNNGEIYNNAAVTGGIAGWWTYGNMENVFNTGNITVLNKDSVSSAVGGLVGSVGSWNVAGIGENIDKLIINNAYNLGSLRSFTVANPVDKNKKNIIGGIIGEQRTYAKKDVTTVINNVYTLGNLYAAKKEGTNGFQEDKAGRGGIIGSQFVDGTNNLLICNIKLSIVDD